MHPSSMISTFSIIAVWFFITVAAAEASPLESTTTSNTPRYKDCICSHRHSNSETLYQLRYGELKDSEEVYSRLCAAFQQSSPPLPPPPPPPPAAAPAPPLKEFESKLLQQPVQLSRNNQNVKVSKNPDEEKEGVVVQTRAISDSTPAVKRRSGMSAWRQVVGGIAVAVLVAVV